MKHLSFLAIIAFTLTACTQVSQVSPEEESLVTVNNEQAGFSFAVPEGVSMNKEDDFFLSLDVRVVESLDEAGLYSKSIAEAVMESLKKGEKGPGLDFEEENSEKVIKLGDINGREGVVMGRFEVCDVTFEKILAFYPEKDGKVYQVVLNLRAPREKMMEAFPDYFYKDPDNCGEELVWKQQAEGGENMRIFSKFNYYIIEANEHPLIVKWNNAFEEIKGSIRIDN